MTVIATLLGSLLVLVALRDVFDTIFHPHGRGVVGETLIRGVWRLSRGLARGNHALLSFAGPLSFLTVITAWGALVVVGFAMIIWPHLPDSFAFSASLDPAGQDTLADALYLSLVNLTSLGYGDIVPTSDLLRLLSPLETVIGLGLLTASISWILFLYRVLSDYRALSHEIALLIEADGSSETGLAGLEPSAAASVLADLTSRVIAIRDDLVHSPIAYYYHPRDARHALPVLLPALLDLVEACSAPDRAPALRFEATMLGGAIRDLLSTIAEDFTQTHALDVQEALAGYRGDHLWAAD